MCDFRKPDRQYLNLWGVWYDPGGENGDCATEVLYLGEYYIVREYQNIL